MYIGSYFMLCIGLYIDCSDELYDDHCVHCLGIMYSTTCDDS